MDYKIINARVDLDCAVTGIYVKDGIIEKIGTCLPDCDEVYNAGGNLVTPGLIDMNCTIGDPGYEYKENFASIANAAQAAGFTTITCQPNGKPVADNKAVIEYIISKSISNKKVNLIPYGSMTSNLKGIELSEIGEMYADGIVGVSDGGQAIQNPHLLRTIMIYSTMFGIPVITSCQDNLIAGDGVINEGYMSTLSGLKGIPREAEEIVVARNIILAEHTKANLHLTQISTEGSVNLVRQAKARGVRVTCDTSPQYFSLTEQSAVNYNTFAKVKPPLRTQKDIAAVSVGLQDGTIDAISSGHTPTTIENKMLEFDKADFGISSLETVFAISYTELVLKNILSPSQLIEKLSKNPANILKVKGRGSLAEGCKADIAVFDIENEYEIKGSRFKSKSKFSPYENKPVKGRAITTFTDNYWQGRFMTV